MNTKVIIARLKAGLELILELVVPHIQKLIKSSVVPALKRQMYEKLNDKTNSLIKDLAQNAAKVIETTDEKKKTAYIEGTKLGIETIRALAEKLNAAANEIEKVVLKNE